MPFGLNEGVRDEGKGMRIASEKMALLCIVVSIALLVPFAVPRSRKGTAPDSAKILRNADALVTFSDTDFSALYTFEQGIPGQGTSSRQAMVFRATRTTRTSWSSRSRRRTRGRGTSSQETASGSMTPCRVGSRSRAPKTGSRT